MGYINTLKVKNDILVWERNDGKREIVNCRAPYYFYIKSDLGEYTSIYGDTLTRLDFATAKEFNEAKAKKSAMGIEMFESDIQPDLKLLSEKYYGKPAPKLHTTFYDIENDYDLDRGYATMDDPYAPINAVALYNDWQNRMVVYAVPPKEYTGTTDPDELLVEMDAIAALPTDCEVSVVICDNEHELLQCFLEEIEDSDVLSGWNSVGYDDTYTAKRLEMMGKRFFNRLSFPEGNSPKFKDELDAYGGERTVVELSGRIQADYLQIFKKYEVSDRPSFKLEAIADEILVDPKTKKSVLPKLEYKGSLARQYKDNFLWFMRYNLRDTEILKGFEERLGYIELANQMCHLSTGLFKHVTGTIKLSELATINYCHHEMDNLIVNDIRKQDDHGRAKGAFVLLPQVGEHPWIGAIDINSLYPSAIRSNNISPETIIGQFTDDEAAFHMIRDRSFQNLTLAMDDGQRITKPADVWRDELIKANWSVSGFGTVFDQAEQGIMPAILEYWYSTRKMYQAKMREARLAGNEIDAQYYDKLQYVYKIKLNSYYGSLLNDYFRFYDNRLGESTTGTSRAILLHQCSKVAELLDGKYAPTDVKKLDDKGVTHIGYSDKYSVVYGDSVAADTKIIISDGTSNNIEDLFKTVQETHNNGKEYYFPKDLKTLTYDEKINKSTFEDVLYVMRHKTTKKMYRVWLTNSTYVDVTEDHSLIGYKNTQKRLKGESPLVEIKAKELGGDINSVIFLKNIPRSEAVNIGYSKEIYEFLGLIIGDGYCAKKSSGGIGLSAGAQDVDEISRKVLDPLIDQGYITSYKVQRNTHDIRICGTKIYDLTREALYVNNEKQLPEFIFKETIENISSFLRGYFSADGTICGGTVSLCSVRLDFITQAQTLLFYCGVSSNYFTENTENSYNGVYSGTYSKKLSVKNTEVFEKLIGFLLDRKTEKIPKNGKYTNYLSKYDFAICSSGIAVEEIEYDGYVYDIEVGNTHVFFANNVLVHNTDSTYFRTHGENEEDACAIADAVGEQCSASFPEFMRESFLCGKGFDDIIKTGREIVADNGIFVDKKRYFLHIVDNEGVKCDKSKVMGLDTKKTTLPKEVSNTLNGHVEAYLKGKEWGEIAIDLVDYKEDLYNTKNIMSIGLPKGIKKVEYYTLAYADDPKTFLPGHVSASIHYNERLVEYDDKESIKIKSGMKIKVFYLNRKYGRFKAIAIPVDIEIVPQWFLDDFTINRDMHIERLVDKPMNNIIKAIGKETPSKQSLFTDDLLGM